MNNFRTNYSKLEEKAKVIKENINTKVSSDRAKVVYLGSVSSALNCVAKENLKDAEEMLNNIKNFISNYVK